MNQQRILLFFLGLLTFLFLGLAAFTFYGNPFPNDGPQVITLPTGEVPEALRLTVYETGIAALSMQDLRETFFYFENVSADSFRLTRDGEEVPYYLSGNNDNATLYFYAQAITNTLEAPAVYWLSADAGTEMRRRDATPGRSEGITSGRQQRRWEDNLMFLPLANGDDNWLGEFLFAPATWDLELDNILTTGGPGELRVHLWSNNESLTDPDHHVIILLNGDFLTEHYWDGITQQTIAHTIPEGVLQEGANVLTLDVPGDTGGAGEAIYVDWITLDYESRLELGPSQLVFRSADDNISVQTPDDDVLVFDVTDPQAPAVLQGASFNDGLLTFAGNPGGRESTYLALPAGQAIVPQIAGVLQRATLKSADIGADYIAIVANEEGFATTLEPLLAHRREQGLRVVSVPVDQIYDEFGYGRQTPQAIRDFLIYATAEWQEPAPQYVLLVGDASFDIYDFTGGKNKNLIPTYLTYTDHAGYVASDTWFSMLEEDSSEPLLALGRFPAQNARQLEAMVNKTIEYERQEGAEWISRALLVADDEPRFDEASDELDERLSQTGFQTQKLYMTENEDIRDAIISALNHGVGILNYVGHGSVAVWGDEQVLRAEDADILVNGTRLPIFTTFTCLNGYFNHPAVDALAETLLAARGGGVVAAVVPSGRSFTWQQAPLADRFYHYLLTGEAGSLGRALMLAKRDAVHDQTLEEVIHTFNLLGDPALVFHSPQPAGAASGN